MVVKPINKYQFDLKVVQSNISWLIQNFKPKHKSVVSIIKKKKKKVSNQKKKRGKRKEKKKPTLIDQCTCT